MKTTWLNAGWYPVRIGFVPDKKAWKVTQRELQCPLGWPEHHGGAYAVQLKDENDNCVILVCVDPKLDDPTVAVCALAHESVHVWQFIRDHIGEKHPGMEQEAYAVQKILEQFLNAYSETKPQYRRKKKRKC